MTVKLNFQHTTAEFAQAIQEAANEVGFTPEQFIGGLAMDWQKVKVDRAKKAQLMERYVEGLNEIAGSVVNVLVGGVIKEVW
jgi:hypothetical protein